MIETELKFTLDAAGEARLRRHPAFEAMRLAPRRTRCALAVILARRTLEARL